MARREQKRRIVIVNWDKYNKPPRAALSSAHRKDYETEPLNWFRLECNWYRDVDILELKPAVRSLWPQLLAMAAASIPHGMLFTSVQTLAKAGNLRESDVAEALTFLWKRHKIRYSPAGKRQPVASQQGGYVPTYLRTDIQTAETSSDEHSGTTRKTRTRYSDDPMCRRCDHPKVVHRGKLHDGECAGITCACPAFQSEAA